MQQHELSDLAPAQVAVVLVDFQNDFCHPAASQAQPPANTTNAATAHRANQFAAKAAAAGAHVIYTRQVLDLDQLTPRQRRWERPDGLCAAGSWGAELFIDPVPGASVVIKHRFDVWQSWDFTRLLEAQGIDGLVIGGVELCCCVLYAVLGASERGFRYVAPQDLVAGQDSGEQTYNRAVRDYLRWTHQSPQTADDLLKAWQEQAAT
jgi:nicotinamidase-related amidase